MSRSLNHTRKLVIIGSTHHNTYSMVRCFGESNVKPDVILCGKADSYILHSTFVNEYHIASDATDALRLLRENYEDAVVIACADDIASLMDLNYDEMRPHFQFFNCSRAGVLTHFMDKSVQASSAAEVGLKVPVSLEGTPTDIMKMNLFFPCIIKPLESIHGGKNIQICQSLGDISMVMTKFNPGERVLVQEYVERDYEIVVVGLSFGNEIAIPAFIHRHRDTKGGTTYSTVKPIEDISSDVVAACRKLMAKMKYQGLFGIEFILQGEDYYFIEVNLRNDATTYAISVAGCNLPLAYWKLCNNEKAVDLLTTPARSIHAMVELNDFIHVLKREVSFITWCKQLRNSQCRYCYSKKDRVTFRYQLFEFMGFLVKIVYTRGKNLLFN